jgi:exodeoxyribonuclease VII large subunit
VPALADLVAEHLGRIDQVRSIMQRALIDRQYELNQIRLRCERIRPDRQLAVESDRLAQLQQRLRLVIAGRLQTIQQEQLRLQERCQALDPRLVLQRGYALVRQQHGSIVRDSASLVIGKELDIQFAQGQATVRVIEIKHGQKK